MTAIEALDSNARETGLSPESALTGLFERHGDRIFGFCLRRLGSRQEAEDAHQNTFLYAFRALQRGVRPVSETAWLFKIAENACLAAHRTNGRRRAREIDHEPELVGVPAGDEESGTAAALRAALDKLPTNQRQALLLREWRGLSYREIASELGLTVAAVETLIFRARRSVARTLSRDTGIRARLAGVLDLGSLAGALKSAFSGAAAVKLAAGAAVVALATLPAGDAPLQKSSPPAGNNAFARRAESSPATRSGRPEPSLPGSRASRSHGRPGTPAAGGSSRPSDNGVNDGAQAPPPGGAGAPGAPGGAGPPAANTPVAPAVPREIQPPTLPKVEVPAVPELPQLPQLPALPQAPAPPELPALPALPALPEVPEDPNGLLLPSPHLP
jgi:RNA polymerase sigma-70 factor (ECF subfamily)